MLTLQNSDSVDQSAARVNPGELWLTWSTDPIVRKSVRLRVSQVGCSHISLDDVSLAKINSQRIPGSLNLMQH